MALTIFLNNKKVQCHFSLLFLFRLDTRRSTRMVKAKTGNLPVLLVDTTDVLLIVADTIWCHIRDSREALLAYIGTFYVLDYDYPAAYEIGLTMVHFFLSGYKQIPSDQIQPFNSELQEYLKYEAE